MLFKKKKSFFKTFVANNFSVISIGEAFRKTNIHSKMIFVIQNKLL